MSWTLPKAKPVPEGQKCEYGCGKPAHHYFKTPKRWCCSTIVMSCEGEQIRRKVRRGEKKEKVEKLLIDHPVFDMEHLRVLYPITHVVETRDDNIRFNRKLQIMEAKCTHFECPTVWYNVPEYHIQLREWALEQDMDGYKFYCGNDCRKLCYAHGKTGAMLQKDLEDAKLIDLESIDEWYGGNASQGQKDYWRKFCLERDEYTCQRCGAPAEHVHHMLPVKTHPESEIDPIVGISVCIPCHFVHFHKRGTDCATNKLASKSCFAIVNGEKCKMGDRPA